MKINYHSGKRLQRGFGIGLNYHYGPQLQKGHGIGSLFSGLFRMLKPIGRVIKNVVTSPAVKSIAKNVGKTALDIGTSAATDIAADLIEGKDVTETAQQKFKEARQQVAQKIRQSANNEGGEEEEEEEVEISTPKPKIKRKTKRKKVTYQTKPKRTKRDIFD